MSIYLGIHVGHNASASLMKDGELLYALQEERFNGQKNFVGFPDQCLIFLKKFVEKNNLNIDTAGFGSSDCPIFELKYPINHFFSIKEFHEYYGDNFYSRKLKKLSTTKYLSNIKKDKRFKKIKNIYSHVINFSNLFENYEMYRKISKARLQKIFKDRLKKISFLDHHTCHAYYGKFALKSNEKKFAVIILDSMGDGINQSIWINNSKNNLLKNVLRNEKCELARIYKFVTLLLNLKPDEHEFKVMGMAPYAKEKYYMKIVKEVFKDILQFKGLKIVHKKRPKDLFQFLKNKLKFHRFDNIAGAVQFYLEEMVDELVTKVGRKYKINTFFFSGGISMNIKMYNRLAKNKKVKKIYNPPSGSDESISIGACYYLNRKENFFNLKKLSLGMPLVLKNKKLETVLNSNFRKSYSIQKNVPPEKIANLLIKNKIIALVNGREEFGARALGNRSIVANPSDFENIKRINTLIKSRDFWMPFALTIRSENVGDFIINPKKLRSDFMNLSFNTKERNVHKIVAGCHPYDKTVRPQFLSKEHNQNYYDLLSEFGKLSGTYALLNTSLNLHGSPKCSEINSVIKTFKNSCLEYLYINNKILITKS